MGRVAVLLTGALVVHQLTVHAQAGERRIAVLPMEASRVEWLVGGEESELFSNPGRFALLDSLVVVADAREPAITALDVRTGRVVWRQAREGSGPGELRQPSFAAWHPRGVVIADNGTRRLLLYSTAGALLEETPVPGGLFVVGVCGLADGRVVIAHPPAGEFVSMVVELGSTRSRPLPDPLPTARLSLTERHVELTTVRTGGEATGCIAVRTVSDGVAYFGPDQPAITGSYIERRVQRKLIPPMQIRDTSQLPIQFAAGASVWRDRVVVQSGRSPGCRGVCLDLYDLRTLRYRQTIQLRGSLGVQVRSLAVGDGFMIVLGTRDGFPVVLRYPLQLP